MPGLAEIGQVVLKKNCCEFPHLFQQFCYPVPFKKGMVLYLNKLESPLHKDALYLVWLNCPSDSGEGGKYVKSLQTDGQTDSRR